MRKKVLLLLLVATSLMGQVRAQNTKAITLNPSMKMDSSKHSKLHFRAKSTLIERDYRSNLSALHNLDTILLHSSLITNADTLIIVATSSPDGNRTHNELLAKKRAEAIKGYIVWRYSEIYQHGIKTIYRASTWDDMIPLIEADTVSPYKIDVLAILSYKNSAIETEQQLRELSNGKAWSYIRTHYLPYFRNGIVRVVPYCNEKNSSIDEPIINTNTHLKVMAVDGIIPVPSEESDIIMEEETFAQIVTQPTNSHTKRIRPIALKTNLLFDAITALNIEVEIPVAERWSIAGEYIFPWWVDNKKQNCFQVASANLEVRYWLKPNYKKQDHALGEHNPLTGWFVGLYGGGGYYDLEHKGKGYQGEFFIATGINGGYVQPLSRSLSMEFSLGVGYMKTNYRHYEATKGGDNQWHLIHQSDGAYTWIGPTRAKVSLIWYPNFKSNKRGDRR